MSNRAFGKGTRIGTTGIVLWNEVEPAVMSDAVRGSKKNERVARLDFLRDLLDDLLQILASGLLVERLCDAARRNKST